MLVDLGAKCMFVCVCGGRGGVEVYQCGIHRMCTGSFKRSIQSFELIWFESKFHI